MVVIAQKLTTSAPSPAQSLPLPSLPLCRLIHQDWWCAGGVMGPVAFDEMSGDGRACRPAYGLIKNWLEATAPEYLKKRQQEAEFLFRRVGITFAVYGDAEAEERIIPFDIVPRVLTSTEWTQLSKGLTQRVTALTAFSPTSTARPRS